MTATQRLSLTIFVFALAALGREAAGQVSSAATAEQPSSQVQPVQTPSVVPSQTPPANSDSAPLSPALQILADFKESDIKFNLQSFTDMLRDRRHEGWVLAAYPDPKTNRPLIGAGFSLDVPETPHPQRDPLNPHPFIEPSSAQLWQAAGFEPERLQRILDQFNRHLETWGKKNYRKKIRLQALSPDLTEEEASQLLRISAIQAIQNAKAYCRDFDQLTASQQMALSHLVFQMGVNLEEFVHFLGEINPQESAQSEGATDEIQHWKTVQSMLMESQWAKLYTGRAATVIAMFDPNYSQDPEGMVRRVEATIHPVGRHHRNRQSARVLRVRNSVNRSGKMSSKRHAVSKQKRKLT